MKIKIVQFYVALAVVVFAGGPAIYISYMAAALRGK